MTPVVSTTEPGERMQPMSSEREGVGGDRPSGR
jgi:hypothetical protein